MWIFKNLSLSMIVVLFFTLTVAALADEGVGFEESIKMRKSMSISGSNEYALGAVARLGVNLSSIVEAGVEGYALPYGTLGAGLYVKVPLGDSHYYGIAGVGKTKWFVNQSNYDTTHSTSVGVGYTFKSGAFIEARTGQMKAQWKDKCVHNDYGDCTDGGTKGSPLITITVGKAF